MAAIGTIRNKFGWLLIGLMILSLVAFILMGSESGGGNNVAQITDELALIDGKAISNTNFDDRLSSNITNYKQQRQTAVLTDADLSSIRNTTYNQMVTETLHDKIYQETGIAVGDDEFTDMLNGTRVHPGIANSFKNPETGEFDQDAFNNFINTLDLENNPTDEPGTKRKSWKTFEKAIIQERLTKKFNTLVEKSLTIPTAMAKDQYFNSKTVVSFNYVKVPFSSIADSTLNLSDSDLKAFMKSNFNKYEKDASVDMKIVSFPIVASQNDRLDAENWMKKKLAEWTGNDNDSLFINLYSSTPFDVTYYGKDELNTSFNDSIFDANIGSIFGYIQKGDAFVASKLLDRKMIPDSLKARQLLISLDNVTTQEEYNSKVMLLDSLYNLIDSAGYSLKDLTAQFSDDASTATIGGDLGIIKPGQRPGLNNTMFFDMKQGDVEKVRTQFGLHIVEVYKAKPTKEAVKIATLTKEILASTKTQEQAYATASRFAGNNNTMAKFEAAEETTLITSVNDVTSETNILTSVDGNPRRIVQWAFRNEVGEVSDPFSIGESYYVALLTNKNDKGIPNITDANRSLIQIAAAKEKKGNTLKAKMAGSDLNTIASANGVSVATAETVSFGNTTIDGSPEAKVVGTALGMEEGQTSQAIVGENGVYVISVTSKTAPQDDPSAYTSGKEIVRNQVRSAVTSRIDASLKKAADVVDNRLDFF